MAGSAKTSSSVSHSSSSSVSSSSSGSGGGSHPAFTVIDISWTDSDTPDSVSYLGFILENTGDTIIDILDCTSTVAGFTTGFVYPIVGVAAGSGVDFICNSEPGVPFTGETCSISTSIGNYTIYM